MPAPRPASPAYLAMALGLVFLLLGIFSRGATGRVLVWREALDRAPLFFYVLHLYVLRSMGLAAVAFVWGTDQLGPPPQPSTPEVALWAMWLIWLAAMLALTPPTGCSGKLKARSGSARLKSLNLRHHSLPATCDVSDRKCPGSLPRPIAA